MDYVAGTIRWSDILESQYGLQPEAFGGTVAAFMGRVHPEDRTSVLETLEESARSGAEFSVQNRAIRPDGTVRWLSGTGRFQLEDGKPARRRDLPGRH